MPGIMIGLAILGDAYYLGENNKSEFSGRHSTAFGEASTHTSKSNGDINQVAEVMNTVIIKFALS